MLAAINLRSAPENIWFIWPLLSWGIGIVGHGLTLALEALLRRGGTLARKETHEHVVHLFVYLSVRLLLAFINLTGDSDGLWLHWVVLGWGAWRRSACARPMTGAGKNQVVRTGGLEPPRGFPLRILSPVCLPVPPRPH